MDCGEPGSPCPTGDFCCAKMRQLDALGSNRVLIVVLLLRQVQKTSLRSHWESRKIFKEGWTAVSQAHLALRAIFCCAKMRQLAALGSNRVLIVVLFLRQVQKTPLSRGVLYLAEKEGFEPSMGLLTPYSLSRGAPSATRPLLQILIAGPVKPARRCRNSIKTMVLMFSNRARIITAIGICCQKIGAAGGKLCENLPSGASI